MAQRQKIIIQICNFHHPKVSFKLEIGALQIQPFSHQSNVFMMILYKFLQMQNFFKRMFFILKFLFILQIIFFMKKKPH